MRWPFSTPTEPDASNHAWGASEAEREAALLRLWDATRPIEPEPAAWDAIWARVSERLDQADPAAPEPLAMPAVPWRRYAVTTFVVAQAAAILASAVLWGVNHRPAAAPKPDSPTSVPLVAVSVPHREIDIEAGGLVLIHLEAKDLRAEEMPPEARSGMFDEMLMTFNHVEAMAESQPNAYASQPPG